MASGVTALSLAMKRIPYIRYQNNSLVCEKLANRLIVNLQSNKKLIQRIDSKMN